jgi:hypothetical protein
MLSVLNRITISSRLWIILSTYSVYSALIVVFLISKGENRDIDFASTEKLGVAYQRPLEQLLHLVPLHQDRVANSMIGDQAARTAIDANEAKIDAAFDEITAEQATVGDRLKFTPQGLAARGRDRVLPSTVRGEWQALRFGNVPIKADESEKQHLDLIADIRTMIVHAGDMSNLILDPVLDSYYACDATLGALPQTQDRLAVVDIFDIDPVRDRVEIRCGGIGSPPSIQAVRMIVCNRHGHLAFASYRRYPCVRS